MESYPLCFPGHALLLLLRNQCVFCFAPCKRIRIPESVKALLVESGIRENLAVVEPGILGFGIQNTAQGILKPLRIGIQNPRFTKNTGIQYLGSGIHGMAYRIEDCLGFPDMGRVIICIWFEEDKKIKHYYEWQKKLEGTGNRSRIKKCNHLSLVLLAKAICKRFSKVSYLLRSYACHH